MHLREKDAPYHHLYRTYERSQNITVYLGTTLRKGGRDFFCFLFLISFVVDMVVVRVVVVAELVPA